ncbi:MAG TPA: AraC family transcriptional regulator [Bryobacteraceae bacterium]|nr:AraC family transcriptional regulator [Bryobacteraceae bacterium]
MAKIAVASEKQPAGVGPNWVSGGPTARLLAAGDGWTVSDVVCSAGPLDRPFEERHSRTSIAIVVSGTFQYRSSTGRELMTPGSLLLGNAGECFMCGHEHATGDRCVSFSYAPEFFDRLASEAGVSRMRFDIPRLPPIRALAQLAAKASALLAGADRVSAEELSIQVAAQAIQIARGVEPRRTCADASSLARVTRVVRMIDTQPDTPHDLASLARIARLSRYHFLRAFERLTGTTPHQYLLRARLRKAAVRLRTEPARVVDIALECGFGDISNFNRTFRTEFGVSPRVYRSRPSEP